MALRLEHWCLAPVVKSLMAMRGIDLVTAMGIVAELSDISRQNRQQTRQKAIDRIGLVLSVRRSQERQNTTSGGAL